MELITENTLLLVFFLTVSCFLFFTTARSRGRASTLPPGPRRLPIIGNLHLVGKSPHRSFADLSKTYGPVMSLKLGCLNTVVVTSPEAAREVLKTHDQVLSGRYVSNSIRSVNHHEFSVIWLHSSTARWRMLRKLLATHLFWPQRIEATKTMRMKKVQDLVSFVKGCSEREEVVNISHASYTTILNIISNVVFSVDIGSYDSTKSPGIQEMVIKTTEVGKADLANFYPFLRFFDVQGNTKILKAIEERMLKILRPFINAKKTEKSLRNNPKDVPRNDLVDELLLLTEGDKAELDINEIEHLLLDMFAAGTDANSSTLQWAMTELIANPEKMAKAQAEIDRVIGQKGIIEESDISKLPYLQAVVKETFRFHPAVPFLIPRKADTNVKVLGFHVPKDSQVLVNVWGIGRDPSLWENPNRFEPERFLGKEIDVIGKDFELTPFGAGRRICPGLPLAVMNVSLTLASLLYSFDWKLPNGYVLDTEESFGVTLHKTNPLLAIPVKRVGR